MSTEAWLWVALAAMAAVYYWVGRNIVSKPREYYPLLFLKFPSLVTAAIILPVTGLAAVATVGFLITPIGWWYLGGAAGVFFFLAVRPHMLTRKTTFPEEEPLKEMERMLSEQRRGYSADMARSVRDTVTSGDLSGFRALLKHLPNLNERLAPENWMLLHFLAAQGQHTKPVHAIMADDLLKAGADVNCRTDLGWTPIHMIAGQGQKEACDLVRILIAHGADLTAVDKMGADWKLHWQHGNEIRAILEEASARR